MIAGISFPDRFTSDLFTARRSGTVFTSGNPFDPESLITGAEAASGYTFVNSRRYWPSENHYRLAVGGQISTDTIVEIAPRCFIEFVDVDGEAWAIVKHPTQGIRALHGEFTEWPMLSRSEKEWIRVSYTDGRRKSATRSALNFPERVKAAIRRMYNRRFQSQEAVR